MRRRMRCVMVTAMAKETKRMGPKLGIRVSRTNRDEPIPESMPSMSASVTCDCEGVGGWDGDVAGGGP